MPLSAIAVLFSSSLITTQRGVEGFALFSIFIALPYMVPISDFGISVSITDTLARHGKDSAEFRYVWNRTLLILVGIAFLAIVTAILIALLGAWSPLLGLPPSRDTEVAGMAMMAIMALGIPLGAGQRALLGLGNQTIATILSSSSGIVSLLCVLVVLAIPDSGYAVLAIAYGLGPLLTQVTIFAVAVRRLGPSIRRLPHPPAHIKTRIINVALPMAVLTVALPLTYQTDRVILSHLSSLEQVADYSYVSIYYMPLLSVITVGSQALWPLFMKTMDRPRRLHRQFRRASLLFTSLGFAMMLGIVMVGPFATRIVTGGQSEPSMWVYCTFGLMLFVFGFHAASGMLLMDHRGRKLQAAGAVLMLVTKIPVSLLLVPLLGAAGTLLATLVSMVVWMIVPARISAIRRLRAQQCL